jgi:5-methylcytosine-specific restriction endonuclease McrA
MAVMIHVDARPELRNFDRTVRKKGLAYMRKNRIALDQPLLPDTHLEPYWRECLNDLYSGYNGCCAYLAVFFERVTGAGTVDHFIAKSRRADLAYEWTNYRLACSRMNSRKREYDDVLDPFTVENDGFHLELVSGHVYPNPKLSDLQKKAVCATIERLGLDDPGNREMRARHYQEYREGAYNTEFLQKRSPFVWSEAARQGLL